ncbi:putative family 17 glucosidase SCW10 [Amylocarpus encephaloides]|uniref:Family 17 glucosidase SCW10 n=1 Tax=Amylocarpus encephaloides TaxID=45428 RepID=A0A9P8CA80_9HELO|nr:putative family 17 glucosidase SCW10 [Amylocarpus encephaloides]
MKTATLALAAASLLQLTLAQPFRARPHQHQHEKKNAEPDKVVIIYQNADGQPTSTTTSTIGSPTIASEVKPVVAQQGKAQAPSETTAAKSSTGNGDAGNGNGFSYSPYKGDENSHAIKTQDDVNKDLSGIPDGYSLIRLYGTDQHQTKLILDSPATKSKGWKVFAGIFDIEDGKLENCVKELVADVAGRWDRIHTVSVGNEKVNFGASPDFIVGQMDKARTMLKAAGYGGFVVTTDTLFATVDHPILCDKSDYCAVNCHPFFDQNVAASESGNFLKTQMGNLRSKLAKKDQRIVITETGWPFQGTPNGAGVPSRDNQKAAIRSIKDAFKSNPQDVILFNSFNRLWIADNENTHEAEKFWGFLGDESDGNYHKAPSEIS